MFRNFRNKARENKVSEESIRAINTHTVLCGQDVRLSSTNDNRVEILRNFIKQHPIVVLYVNKLQDIAVISRNSYHENLGELFLDNPNVEPIEDLPIEDLTKNPTS